MELGFPLATWFFPLVICFFTSFSLSSSTDPQYEACSRPASCGEGPNISYPFRLPSQPYYCGQPGFDLVCRDRQPVLQRAQNDYQILNIFQGNQSLLVVNHNWTVCQSSFKFLDFSFAYPSFEITRGQPYLLLKCTYPYEANLTYRRIECSGTRTLLVYKGTQPYSEPISDSDLCDSDASVPINLKDSIAKSDLSNPWALLAEGFSLTWNSGNCTECGQSGGYCGYNHESSQPICFCRDGPHPVNCRRKSRKEMLMAIAGAIAAISIFFITAVCFYWKCSLKNSLRRLLSLRKKDKDNSHKVEAFLRTFGSTAPKRYKYYEIKKMADSFKVKLGQGGFGGVFKGKLLDGRHVAVKVLTESKGNGEEFVNEVASIGRTYHVNIVTLLGFCSEGPRRALVYEFMPNGSLEKVIYNRKQETANPVFRWEKLLQIAVGIARGLEYLHCGCSMRILHFDIKPHNILLDDNYCPKISDFGLAKLCPNQDTGTISMLVPRGTVGYIAPEVLCRNIGRVSYRSDVYSYGMMVLEMAGGRRNVDVHVDNTSEIYFPHWVFKRIEQNETLGLEDEISDEEEGIARKMIMVGLWCIQTEPGRRPSMSKVLEMLDGEVGSIEMPPTPFPSSSH